MCAGTADGAGSLKKSHHIVTLRFSEEVKDHANCPIVAVLRQSKECQIDWGRGFVPYN